MKNIIFEDDNIVVIMLKTESDTWVVTFGDALNLANKDVFFADKFMAKSGNNAIGFMAKHPNWYPKPSILNSLSAVNVHLIGNPHVLMYGGSMGGYAAIKYSKLFNAKCIVALCPQWSIDPIECSDFEPGFGNFYTESMAGMSIKKDDISGDLYLFADPQLQQDVIHRNKIIEIYPSATPINVYSAGHNVTGIIAGSNNLENIFSGCKSQNISQITLAVTKARKNSVSRLYTITNRLANRHPIIFAKLLISKLRSDAEDLYLDIASEYFIQIVRALSDRGEFALLKLWAQIRTTVRKVGHIQSLLIKSSLINGSVYLKTHHDTVIAFDILNYRICHIKLEKLLDRRFNYCKVNIEILDSDINFYLDLPGMRALVANIFPDGSVGFQSKTNLKDDNLLKIFKYQELLNNKIAIIQDKFYLSADELGRINFSKSHCFNWEWYELIYM